MLVPTLVSRPEDELLLCCARTNRTPEVAARIGALLREGMDWEYLIPTAHVHGRAPLLYCPLDATYPKAVPENAFDPLRDHFSDNILRTLSLTGKLPKILKAFGAQGIPAVPYK